MEAAFELSKRDQGIRNIICNVGVRLTIQSFGLNQPSTNPPQLVEKRLRLRSVCVVVHALAAGVAPRNSSPRRLSFMIIFGEHQIGAIACIVVGVLRVDHQRPAEGCGLKAVSSA
jgi:hypothetical protein